MPGPILVAEIFKIIQYICQEGLWSLLSNIVEQNTQQTLVVCDRDYVLENGRHVLSGTG